jgi:arginine-tRNA-protein transferase
MATASAPRSFPPVTEPVPQAEEPFFLAHTTQACPYLPDRVATLAFGDGHLAADRYRELLDQGYRRNGRFVYRPVCTACNACEVLRVPVAAFQPSRSQRRVWKRCHGRFQVQAVPPAHSQERVQLYGRYLEGQHRDPEAEENATHYEGFLVDTCLGDHTFELQYRDAGRLVGVGIVDHVGDALSSVYFYFDPAWARYSLGTYSALLEIDLARRWGLRHYYLGYYIADCPQMRYKAAFRPCEVRRRDGTEWLAVP